MKNKCVSSTQLSKMIGVTQKTAWHILHQIRKCMVISVGFLDGIVEVDETFI